MTANPMPSVTVCEKSARWVPELQRQFAAEQIRVRGCRRTAELRRLAASADVIVIDFDSDPAGCLQFLGGLADHRPVGPMIVIGSPQTAALEWIVRDLGALDFFPEAPAGHVLADLCRRQWTLEQCSTL